MPTEPDPPPARKAAAKSTGTPGRKRAAKAATSPAADPSPVRYWHGPCRRCKKRKVVHQRESDSVHTWSGDACGVDCYVCDACGHEWNERFDDFG